MRPDRTCRSARGRLVPPGVPLPLTQKEKKILVVFLVLLLLGLVGMLLLRNPQRPNRSGQATSFSRPAYQAFSTFPG
jgi:hypothetical protein